MTTPIPIKEDEHKNAPSDSRYVLITVESGMLTFPFDVMVAKYYLGKWVNVQGDRVSEQYTGRIIEWRDFEPGDFITRSEQEK